MSDQKINQTKNNTMANIWHIYMEIYMLSYMNREKSNGYDNRNEDLKPSYVRCYRERIANGTELGRRQCKFLASQLPNPFYAFPEWAVLGPWIYPIFKTTSE